jgi:hypothetical protein
MGFSKEKIRFFSLITLLCFWVSTLGPVALAQDKPVAPTAPTEPPEPTPSELIPVEDVIQQMNAMTSQDRLDLLDKKILDEKKKKREERLTGKKAGRLTAGPGTLLDGWHSYATNEGIKFTKSWEITTMAGALVLVDIVAYVAILKYMNLKLKPWKELLAKHTELQARFAEPFRELSKAQDGVLDQIAALDDENRALALEHLKTVEFHDPETADMIRKRLQESKPPVEKVANTKAAGTSSAAEAATVVEGATPTPADNAEIILPEERPTIVEPQTVAATPGAEADPAAQTGLEKAGKNFWEKADILHKKSVIAVAEVKTWAPYEQPMNLEAMPSVKELEAIEGRVARLITGIQVANGQFKSFQKYMLGHLYQLAIKNLGREKTWLPSVYLGWTEKLKWPLPSKLVRAKFPTDVEGVRVWGDIGPKMWPSASARSWKSFPKPAFGRWSVRGFRLGMATLFFVAVPVSAVIAGNMIEAQREKDRSAQIAKDQDMQMVQEARKRQDGYDAELYAYRNAWNHVVPKYTEANGIENPIPEGLFGLYFYRAAAMLVELTRVRSENEEDTLNPLTRYRRTIRSIFFLQQSPMLRLANVGKIESAAIDPAKALNRLAFDGGNVPEAPKPAVLDSIIDEMAAEMRDIYNADRKVESGALTSTEGENLRKNIFRQIRDGGVPSTDVTKDEQTEHAPLTKDVTKNTRKVFRFPAFPQSKEASPKKAVPLEVIEVQTSKNDPAKKDDAAQKKAETPK